MTAESVRATSVAADRQAAAPPAAAIPTAFERTMIVVALGVAAYMAALGNSIVNAIPPVIADTFGTDVSAVQWVVTTFLLVQSGLLLTFGRLGMEAPAWLIAAALAVVGLGVGLFTSPNNSALMGAVPARRRGVASGVLSTARTLGMLLGIGLAGAVYATALSLGGGAEGEAVVRAANVGLLVASGLALVGALTSAVRPTSHVA